MNIYTKFFPDLSVENYFLLGCNACGRDLEILLEDYAALIFRACYIL
jgi:hypothetical protein